MLFAALHPGLSGSPIQTAANDIVGNQRIACVRVADVPAVFFRQKCRTGDRAAPTDEHHRQRCLQPRGAVRWAASQSGERVVVLPKTVTLPVAIYILCAWGACVVSAGPNKAGVRG